MNVLHLYRPRLPSSRAQSIQVLRTCHALASRGHKVTLFADRGAQPALLWEQMGLRPHPNLHLHVAPVRHAGLAGIWFRHMLSRWWNGTPGIVLARDKRRLLQAIQKHGIQNHRVVLEAHELDSLQPNGQVNPECHALEATCLQAADAIMTNCGGTLSAWQEHHSIEIPHRVCHNASHIESLVPMSDSEGVLVLGSMRTTKGVESILDAASGLRVHFRWVGGTVQERQKWSHKAQLDAPVEHANIQSVLSAARVLVLPLGNNPFSHRFTSPLKLWDYLATDRPIVAAKTQAVYEICGHSQPGVFFYNPEDIASIQKAIQDALQSPSRVPHRRSWTTRAIEISNLFDRVL